MTGVKGQLHQKRRANTLRSRAWNSIRILRRFTLPDLCRTSALDTGANDYENLKKWVRKLAIHGYVAKEGRNRFRTAADYQVYRLARDIGPDHPLVCERCGSAISSIRCEKKEKEKEKEKETGGAS